MFVLVFDFNTNFDKLKLVFNYLSTDNYKELSNVIMTLKQMIQLIVYLKPMSYLNEVFRDGYDIRTLHF